VGLVSSMDSNLRLNSVWALKNLLFQADSDIKNTVMKQLKYSQLESLISDSEVGIQEQALNLLRNLACGRELVRPKLIASCMCRVTQSFTATLGH
jgi:ethanolamine utilization cobalamin adenosyltransferase